MPNRVQMISFLMESMFLTVLNTFILITWFTVFSAIPIILSSIWTFGRLKRDIDKYHNGSPWSYIKYLFGKVKKN